MLVVVKIWTAIRPVMVAQLAKQLLQIPEIRSSNTNIEKCICLCVNCLRKNENKEHQAGKAYLKISQVEILLGARVFQIDNSTRHKQASSNIQFRVLFVKLTTNYVTGSPMLETFS